MIKDMMTFYQLQNKMAGSLLYIANIRMPTEKAHGLAVMKMCEAFADRGVRLRLLVPFRHNDRDEDPFEYYGVRKVFTIRKLPSIDYIHLFPRVGFVVQSLTFAASVFFFCLFSDDGLIYGRDDWSLLLLSLFKKNVVWEAHTAKRSIITKLLLKRCVKLVVISQGLKDHFISLGHNASDILIASSGVDFSQFNFSQSEEDLREELSLPQDKKIISYIGKYKTMGQSKGVEELVEIFKQISEDRPDLYLLVVGGDCDEEVEHAQGNIKMMKAVRPTQLPKYMAASDILVINYPRNDHFSSFMSPLKLFEYMASGTPIVAASLPSIEEIVNDSSALLVSHEKIGEGILTLANNPKKGEQLALRAREVVQEYTWKKRAERILHFLPVTTS